ncbi:MAG: hypothetical protein WA051_03085 [Minisyncoccia bacterium]
MAKQSSFIEWQTLEYPLQEHGSDWFISVGIIAFAGAIAAVILENYIFAILIMIGTASLLLFAARIPKRITVRIFEKGILLDMMLYPYNTLRSFHVNEHEGKLLLRTNKLFLPILAIHIEDTSPEDIRRILSPNIRQEEIEESFWEKLMDHLGF